MAGAEVVDRHAPAGRVQGPQGERAARVDGFAFGQFEQHTLARQGAGVEQIVQRLREARQAQLRRCQVEREIQLRVRQGHRRQPVGGARHHQVGHRHDQAGAFGLVDELARCQRAALRMGPAHQHLAARAAPGRQVDDGLHVGLELALPQALFDAVHQA